MSKENHLLDHLLNPFYRDESSRLILPGNHIRLLKKYKRWTGNWRNIADFITYAARLPITWFPDANVAFREDTEMVWDALRIAAMGSNTASTVISGVVEYEVSEWLKEPRHHKDRANTIRTALEGRTWISRFGLGLKSPIYPAIMGYTCLLGVRRSLARPCPDGLTLVNTDPAAKSDTINAIRNIIGARALGLAKKGRIDIEKEGFINISDELHCLLVITYALTTGKESVLLTADEDFIEIFWKAQWFLDTHYRAWLAAKMVKEGRYGQPGEELKDTKGFFDGPLVLYRRQTLHLLEVLPPIYRPVCVHVVYVAPNNMIHKASFCFEREMVGLLETRARTNGRCTDLFGQANIHVDLGPLKSLLKGLYLGVGRDAGEMVEIAGIKTFLARLDLEHSIYCQERSAR